MSMRKGASVSQLLAESAVPCAARTMRVLSMRFMMRVMARILGRSRARDQESMRGRPGKPVASSRAPEATSAVAAAMSGARCRSSSRRGTTARSVARARSRNGPEVSGAWKSQPCAAAEKLDAHHAGGVLRHGEETARPVGRHRHVILLVGGGRDGIDARRIGPLLVLGDQGGRGDLRDHEARVQARPGREESRQARQGRVHQHGDAPFRDGADLAERQRDHVGREGDGLRVEIAAGQDLSRGGEHQGIVGHAVGLPVEGGGRLAQDVEAGAHDLGLAAQAIGILHPVVPRQVRGADRAAVHERAQGRRDLDLAGMAA